MEVFLYSLEYKNNPIGIRDYRLVPGVVPSYQLRFIGPAYWAPLLTPYRFLHLRPVHSQLGLDPQERRVLRCEQYRCERGLRERRRRRERRRGRERRRERRFLHRRPLEGYFNLPYLQRRDLLVRRDLRRRDVLLDGIYYAQYFIFFI